MSSHRNARTRLAAAAVALAGLPAARADWVMNLREGVTEISRQIYDLHMIVLWVCVAIGVLVFGAMAYALVTFRKSKGAVPARWDHSNTAELIWTVIPVLILVAMAIPAARVLVFIEDTRDSEMTLKITGYQWKWHYEYVDQGVNFYSSLAPSSNVARQLGSSVDPASVDNYLLDVDRQVVLPVGVKIRYLLTANDVLHSWWMPDFGVKRDAIPGYVNEGWFRIDEPGTYRGQCAELCGRDHGFMPIVVKALPKAEYDAWLTEQKNGATVAQNSAAPAATTSN
jgi:cytochrome c oxidase subunit 2